MAILHLICGLPCSGKTTLARWLEQRYPALRLTPDEWHLRLFGDDLHDPAHHQRHDTVEALLWDVAARALGLGVDVILDFGVWSRSEREDFRARAAQLGAASELHYLDVPEAVLLARLHARNAQPPPGTFVIPEASLREWMGLFQAPDAEELQRRNAPQERASRE